MAIREMLLPEFDQEMTSTRKMLERLPETIPDYKPHEKSMSLSRLAGHVAELPHWTVETMTKEVFELDMKNYKPFEPKTRKEALEAFEKSITEARELLSKSTDEQFGVIWTMKMTGGDTIMSLPRVAVIRAVVMNHLIHHRAQLGVYLRLNNIEIPGMYGPSADEMKFWLKTQTA